MVRHLEHRRVKMALALKMDTQTIRILLSAKLPKALEKKESVVWVLVSYSVKWFLTAIHECALSPCWNLRVAFFPLSNIFLPMYFRVSGSTTPSLLFQHRGHDRSIYVLLSVLKEVVKYVGRRSKLFTVTTTNSSTTAKMRGSYLERGKPHSRKQG